MSEDVTDAVEKFTVVQFSKNGFHGEQIIWIIQMNNWTAITKSSILLLNKKCETGIDQGWMTVWSGSDHKH